MARLTERFERIAKGESKRPFPLFKTEDAVLLSIPVEDINADPRQPRRDLGDLAGLQASIAEYGIVQPLVVSPQGNETYLLIAGERRYTAAKALGLASVPAIVRTVEEHQRLELQLVENLQRKDLNPLEEAGSYQRLINDYNLTQEELGRRLGKSVASINETLRLLDLAEPVREDFRTSEKVSKSVLLEIARQPTEAGQAALWEQAKRGELTVKKAREQKGGAKVASPVMPASRPAAMHFRYPVQTEIATVTITFEQPSATQEEIVAALREALAAEEARLPAEGRSSD